MLLHLKRNSKDHQHVVYTVNAHGINIAQGVAASDAPLHVRVVYQRVEKIRG